MLHYLLPKIKFCPYILIIFFTIKASEISLSVAILGSKKNCVKRRIMFMVFVCSAIVKAFKGSGGVAAVLTLLKHQNHIIGMPTV